MKNFRFLLGYNPVMTRSLGAFHEELQKIFKGFSQIRINIGRLGKEVFQVHIEREGVPTAQQDVITINETVVGMIGDVLYLSRGQKIRLVSYVPERGLEIEFIR